MLLLLTRNVFFNLIKIRHAASREKRRNHKVEKVRKGNERNSRNRRASLARTNKLTARHLRHLAGLLFISFLPSRLPPPISTARRCRRSFVVAAGCWLPPSYYLDALRWRRVETRIKYDEFLPLTTLDTTATTVSRTSRADSKAEKVEIEFQSCFCLSVAVVITILLRHCYVVVCSKSLKSQVVFSHWAHSSVCCDTTNWHRIPCIPCKINKFMRCKAWNQSSRIESLNNGNEHRW